MGIKITSDHHFEHDNIIKYCKRPFANIDEMRETCIQKWNNIVKPTDIVYYLGDFGKAKPDYLARILNRLNGRKRLIHGNHDKDVLKHPAIELFETVQVYLELKAPVAGKHRDIVLFHYPIRSWKGKWKGAYHLHGHSHSKINKLEERIYDVGVDANGFAPVSLEHIDSLLSKIEINPTKEY